MIDLDDDQSPPNFPAESPTLPSHDDLGAFLGAKFESWKVYRRTQEEEWLKDMRVYEQEPEPQPQSDGKITSPITHHGHIVSGMGMSRADTAASRIVEPLFFGAEKHWGIEATPLPELSPDQKLLAKPMIDMAQQAVQAMEQEMEDQLIAMGYQDKVTYAIQEACIIGTGVVKGIVPVVRVVQSWKPQTVYDPKTGLKSTEWGVASEDKLYPGMGDNPISVWDVYPDPYAVTVDGMEGVFERHVLNRGQFESLKNDRQFDAVKISEILASHTSGNHSNLWHESERLRMAKVTDTSAANANRFDVLEYWGQGAGRHVIDYGLEDDGAGGKIREDSTYWLCVWVCDKKAILCKIAPMARQKIPYHFFRYKVNPHQFWGASPIRMIRKSSLAIQTAAIRALCDDLARNVLPVTEVNTNFLKDGQNPLAIQGGSVILREKGDPSVPAIRYYDATSKAAAILPALDVSRRAIDEESNIPSYTQGMQIKGANNTASGTSMLMGAADVGRKNVIKNFEDGMCRPLLLSLYDWNMQFNPREDIKGDMQIVVRGQTSLTTKEIKSQRITQFLQETANPIDMQFVDRRYLLREAATALDIDPDKAVPDLEQMQADQAAMMQPYAPQGQPMLPQGAPTGAGQMPQISNESVKTQDVALGQAMNYYI